MPRKLKITTDDFEIRRWAEQRGGWPAKLTPEAGGKLRIAFPDSEPDANAEPISWEEFILKLEQDALAVEYEERDEEGGLSEFYRIVSRNETAGTRMRHAREEDARGFAQGAQPGKKKKIKRAA